MELKSKGTYVVNFKLFLLTASFFHLTPAANEKDYLLRQLTRNPDEEADFPHGDIVGIQDQTQYWPEKLVYYTFHQSFTKEDKLKLWMAMEEFHTKTCVRFEERTTQKDYIVFLPDDLNRCFSGLGFQTGKQYITLGRNCLIKGVLIHELMHSLGFMHENNRNDRDDYITIQWENILSAQESTFAKFDLDDIDLMENYDYGSIMHFSSFAYAKNPSQPVFKVRNEISRLGQREGLSWTDINKIRRRYECDGIFAPVTPSPSIPPTLSTDVPTTESPKFRCPTMEAAFYPHPTNCYQFYKCSNGRPFLFTCPDNLWYNPEKEMCDWKINVSCDKQK